MTILMHQRTQRGSIFIYCRITVAGVRSEISTFIKLKEGLTFNPKSQRFLERTEIAKEHNKTLQEIELRLLKIKNEIMERGRTLSVKLVKGVYEGSEKLNLSLLDIYQMFVQTKLESVGVEITKTTATTYKVRQKAFIAFLEHENLKEINGVEFTAKHAKRFEAYCKNVVKYDSSSSRKHLQLLKQVLTFGVLEEHIGKNNLIGYTIKQEKAKEAIFLDTQELERLKAYKFLDKLQRVVDGFLFCCYTGLHHEDFTMLKNENLIVRDGVSWIEYDRCKNGFKAIIPISLLFPESLSLIEKYGSIEEIPRITNQKRNSYLKEIAHHLGINKTLSTKTARKTFTFMARNIKGMTDESTAKMLGHQETKYLNVYSGIEKERILNELKR